MAAELLPMLARGADSDNNPYSGAKWFFYASGTTTPQDVYTTSALTVAHANPVVADSGGKFAPIYFDSSLSYRGVLKDASEAVTIFDIDPINAGILSALGSTTSPSGATLVGALGGGDLQDYIWEVSANAFGVVPDTDLDGSGFPNSYTDQATNLQAAVDYAETVGAPVVRIHGEGVIALGSTIEVPNGITIDCSRSELAAVGAFDDLRIVPTPTGEFATATSGVTTSVAADGNCQAGYLFFFNVDPADTTTWIRQFPNMGSGGLRNAHIDGTPTTGISVAFFAGSQEFTNIRMVKVATGIRKPSLYTDHVHIRRIFAETRANATDYLINLPSLGDDYVIEGIASGYTGSGTGVTYGVRVGISRGCYVRGLINGRHLFDDTHCTIEECHIEGGQIVIDGGQVILRNNRLHNGAGALGPIVIQNSEASTFESHSCTLEGNTFIHYANASGGDLTGWATSQTAFDIQLDDNRIDVTLGKGNRRISSISGIITKSQVSAPLIGNTGGSAFTAYQDLAHLLAIDGCHFDNENVKATASMLPLGAWTSISGSSLDVSASTATFQGASDTYYYSVQLLMDRARLIGRGPSGTSEVSVAATNGASSLPSISFDMGSNTRRGGWIIRVYRGTSTGSYDAYADIPAISVGSLIDNGDAVNGWPWITRAASGVDTLNSNAFCSGTVQYTGGIMTMIGAGTGLVPTVGTFVASDRIYNTAAAVYDALVCRTAGTPGTWEEIGIKDAVQIAAVADLNQTIAGPSIAEVQAISDKVDALLAAMRASNLLDT